MVNRGVATSSPVMALFFIAIVGVFVLVVQLGRRWVLDYRLSERGLELLIGRVLPIRLVPLESIREMRCGGLTSAEYAFSLRIRNRLSGPLVLVRTSRPLLWRFVITPDEPEQLVRRFRELAAGSTRS